MEDNVSLDEHRALGKELILDELFDLTLYERMRTSADGDLGLLLDELIVRERRHLLFWEGCFGMNNLALNMRRTLKLQMVLFMGRIFGKHAMYMVLEAIEVSGIRKYLSLQERHKGTKLGIHIGGILRDALVQEDLFVTRYNTRSISPERVRSVFLGFNDGSVEILGAVAGFFIVFSDPRFVLIAGSTVAVAGSISMAAGAFASSSSENEVRAIEEDKARFLGQTHEGDEPQHEQALPLALVVGASYFVGAFLPLLPVLFGATNVLPSVLVSGMAVLLISYILAFLSGMNARRRMTMNVLTICSAVLVSSFIGYVVRTTWGVIV